MMTDLRVDINRPSRAHLFIQEIIQGLKTSTYIEDIWRPQESLIGPPHPQQELIKSSCDECLFGGARGGGKCLANQELVLTPSGGVPISRLSKGDLVLAADGSHSSVLGVYPQEEQELFRISLDDGSHLEATADHIWIVVDQDHGPYSARFTTTEMMLVSLGFGDDLFIPWPTWVDDQKPRRVTSVRSAGSGLSTCIEIGHPSGLFVTHGNIVTHNTDSVLGKWLYHHRDHGGRSRGVIVRRVFKNLEDLIARSHDLFPQTQGKFVGGTAPKWVWSDGAELRIRHLKDEQDARAFQGHGYTFVGVEEAQQYPSFEPIRMLFAAMRSASGVRPQMILTGNPGDVGMGWIKLRYIDPHPEGFQEIEDPELGLTRMFIPSKLEDNPALFHGDPTYERRILASTSNISLQKGWRYGIWDIPSGGYWETVWDPEGRQVLKWFPIPDDWTVVTSFDWGFAKPSALGLWGISNGEPMPEDHPVYPGRVFPANSMILFHQDYTVRKDQSGTPVPNEGLRLTNQALGTRIETFLKKCLGDRYPCPGVADPSIFDDKGGRSIYKQLQEETDYYWDWQPALNARVEGWSVVRTMLEESGKQHAEGPGLWVTDTCTEWRRTFPGLPIDVRRPDDLDTESEDHDADQTRYLAMTWASTPGELYVEEIY